MGGKRHTPEHFGGGWCGDRVEEFTAYNDSSEPLLSPICALGTSTAPAPHLRFE